MIRPLTTARRWALGLCLGLAPMAAGALDLDAMTPAEREAFRAEVRAYLLENPEVLQEAIAVLEARQAEVQAEADRALVSSLSSELYDDGRSWVGGNPDGDIVLVEFMDYRCGFCRRALPEVESFVETDGDVRLVLKEFPILGEESVLASRFAIAVRNAHGAETYKEVHDALMAMRGAVSEGALRRLAQAHELDPAPLIEAMNGPEVTEELRANRALAQQLQISGTPSFVLGGELVRGFVTAAQMAEIAEAARSDG